MTGNACILMNINSKGFEHMIITKFNENMNLPNFKGNTDYIKTYYNNLIALNLPYNMFSPCNEAKFHAVKYMRN